jgi:GTP 3',8-cyclase
MTVVVPKTTQESNSLPNVSVAQPLVDRFGRVHRAIRISVTDACNIRCQYCMPAEGATFLPQSRLLSFDQIASFVRIAVQVGITKIRITGGEPLMRPNLANLFTKLSHIQGVDDLALTTNGMMLSEQLPALVAAGLKRINISLDTLNDQTFRLLARRDGLDKVLAGIAATKAYPQLRVRLNALILPSVNGEDVIPLVEFARAQHLPLRFIEFMPLDAERAWDRNRMVTGAELRSRIAEVFGPLRPVDGTDPSQPATDYEFSDGLGRVGFIDSVTRPFCGNCDRLRLTAEGRLRNCLFGHQEWDVANLLAEPTNSDVQVIEVMRDCVAHKHAAHGISDPQFQQPQRAMYRIGG